MAACELAAPVPVVTALSAMVPLMVSMRRRDARRGIPAFLPEAFARPTASMPFATTLGGCWYFSCSRKRRVRHHQHATRAPCAQSRDAQAPRSMIIIGDGFQLSIDGVLIASALRDRPVSACGGARATRTKCRMTLAISWCSRCGLTRGEHSAEPRLDLNVGGRRIAGYRFDAAPQSPLTSRAGGGELIIFGRRSDTRAAPRHGHTQHRVANRPHRGGHRDDRAASRISPLTMAARR